MTQIKRSRQAQAPASLSIETARRMWLRAQRLDTHAPFGSGPDAVHKAVSQLGYVQIDTIHVIERCHHHILYNRIPDYRQDDLHVAQSEKKSLFEYWTHALAYLPIEAFPFFVRRMRAHWKDPQGWGGQTTRYQLNKILSRIKESGPLAISDITDDRKIEKTHLWASQKPSKFAMEGGFYAGRLVVSRRKGMEKFYDLTERHFGWDRLPAPASETAILDYELDRALTAQGLVSLDSICHLIPSRKPLIAERIEKRLARKQLREVQVENDKTVYYSRPDDLDSLDGLIPSTDAHILSPFDPLIIQRKRTAALFGYEHLFEAYVTPAKRQWGYFTLPVLIGDRIVAGLDLKADRQNDKLLIQNWLWFDEQDKPRHKALIEAALEPFERFQLRRQ